MTHIDLGFSVQNRGADLDIMVFDAIGSSVDGSPGVKAADVAKQVADAKGVSRINVYINSQGGSAAEAAAIYNVLCRAKARKVVHIDGMAVSAASVVAMAGDEILIAENGLVMIHDPWGVTCGDATELRKAADQLDAVKATIVSTYVARTGNSADKISTWMSDETWMTADEAVERHFATKVVPANGDVFNVATDLFSNVPAWAIRSARPKPASRPKPERKATKPEATKFLNVDGERVPMDRITHTFTGVTCGDDRGATVRVLDDCRAILDAWTPASDSGGVRRSGRRNVEFVLIGQALALVADSGIAIPSDLVWALKK